MGKIKKVYKHVKLATVADAKKLGLKPYIDFLPIKISLAKIKKNTKPDNRTFLEMMMDDSPLKSWADLGNCAKDLYDTPGEALSVLARESIKLGKAAPETLMLCEFLENTKKLKINKDKKFNKIIDEHLEQCCTFIGVDYNLVDAPKREMTSKNPKKKHSRQEIIDRVVSKHDRLVVKQPDKYKSLLMENIHTIRKLLK
jgi:hypothetical protein